MYDTPDSFFDLTDFALDLGYVLARTAAVDRYEVGSLQVWDTYVEGSFAVKVDIRYYVFLTT